MKKTFTKRLLLLTALLLGVFVQVYAQTKIKGRVIDAKTREGLAGVNIAVVGSVSGTITDTKGVFNLTVTKRSSFVIAVSYVGYQTQTKQITGDTFDISIELKEGENFMPEVVVSASRVEESVMKSPVSVEKMDLRAIQQTASSNFYDGLANMKGVDITTQGLLFKSINMRGFGSTGNPRVVQMIDGMDNSAPGLNFAVDNIIGMPELDVESVELLPGAASALYGPNAINGLILMNSKSPFLYQGLSANAKTGVMSASNRTTATTPFSDFSIRYAKSINNKFAFKVNFAYLQAKDWESTNYTNLNVGGNADPLRGAGTSNSYDGMNVYGDEAQSNMQTVANALNKAGLLPSAALPLVPNTDISRTGYAESYLVDNNTKSLKFNGALHYRISNKVEAVAQLNYGQGTTLYTGTGRYSLRNFSITQAKIELRGDNFTLRGYTTQENSGDSYTAGLTALGMLNAYSPHANWFGEYVGAFVQARGKGLPEDQSYAAARAYADRNMPAVGSATFNSALDTYRGKLITAGGGAFADKTTMYHFEGTYNFKNQIKFMELLVGANQRTYNLQSAGTLFADMKDGRTGLITINEYGAFVQGGKSLLDNRLKLTASLRYDKNQNFDGQFSPRVAAVFSPTQDHNIRVSYQTGFRIPTTQNQYIDLATPGGTLIGGMPEFDTRYKLASGLTKDVVLDFKANPLKYITPAVQASAAQYATAAVTPAIPTIQAAVVAGVQAQVTTAVTAQVNAAVAAGQIPAAQAAAAIQAAVTQQMTSTAIQTTIANTVQATVKQKITDVATQVISAYALAALPKYQAKPLVPEKIASYEIGYKGLINKKLFIDASYYYSVYKNFIGGVNILVPTAAAGPGLPIESGIGTGSYNGYSRPANSSQDITISGWNIGLNYALDKGYSVGGSVTHNQMNNFTPSSEVSYAGFNTPAYAYKANFGKRIMAGEKWGFNVAWRYQDAFTWESSFVLPVPASVAPFQNTIVPSINNIDAQFSYKIPSMKSIIKVGGTNLFGNPYFQAYGSSSVGTTYYVSISFDELLNK
jgi:iron complex outermembrane recepter protein